ncbi:MAG: chromosomal replication initiator protein DnaA [Burkholderiales bacterium]|nr:chromosomal replication initiator protein DnaA [Burkholderiales bacterium]
MTTASALSAATPLWSACRTALAQELNPQQFSTWIEGLTSEESGGALCIVAPNSFVQDWVRRHFGRRIRELIESSSDCPVEISYKIKTPEQTKKVFAPLSAHRQEAPLDKIAENKSVIAQPAALAVVNNYSPYQINPAFTFDNFVTGKANQLARAASIQVAESPTSYNPLFVYGGVGLGKTHLIQAIGNHLLQRNPSAKVRYLHAEKYVSDVVHAFQHKSFDEFKNYYRSVDLLLIDDIQFFRGKDRTQEEFFYLFNTLMEAHKQVVITCDTYPREIKGIEERLISRFGWGLIVALEPPELEMRVAILIAKAKAVNVSLDEQVAFFIAKHIRSNVRELEGALKRVLAYARFHMTEITLATAKEALRDLIAAQNRQVSIENIQKTVADYYKVRIADMHSKKRSRAIARPRQVAMALAKELTELSLPEIGHRFGGRDHTTVLHACRQIAQLREANTEINHDVNFLLQVLRS